MAAFLSAILIGTCVILTGSCTSMVLRQLRRVDLPWAAQGVRAIVGSLATLACWYLILVTAWLVGEVLAPAMAPEAALAGQQAITFVASAWLLPASWSLLLGMIFSLEPRRCISGDQ